MPAKLPEQQVIWRQVLKDWAKRSKKVVLDEVKANVRGKVLKSRTGRLLRSLRSKLERTGAETDGFSIAVGALHGIAWEKGFTIPRRTISPVRGKALKFIGRGDGSVVFVRGPINIPRVVMKARPFISKAGKDKKTFLEKDLKRSVETVFKRSFPDLTVTITVA